MKELFQVILIVFKLMLFPFAFVLLLVAAKIKVDLVYNVYIRNVVKAFEANGGLKGYPVLTVVCYVNELLNSESMLQVVRMFASKTITPLEIIQNTPSDNKYRIKLVLICRELVIKLDNHGFVNKLDGLRDVLALTQSISELEIRQEF